MLPFRRNSKQIPSRSLAAAFPTAGRRGSQRSAAMAHELQISSLEGLETSIDQIASGEPVSATFVGASSLYEAAAIFRRLQIQVSANRGL